MSKLEELSSKLHDIYQIESKRQNIELGKPVRHFDNYYDLDESTKEYDRVIASFIILREADLKSQIRLTEDSKRVIYFLQWALDNGEFKFDRESLHAQNLIDALDLLAKLRAAKETPSIEEMRGIYKRWDKEDALKSRIRQLTEAVEETVKAFEVVLLKTANPGAMRIIESDIGELGIYLSGQQWRKIREVIAKLRAAKGE